MGRLYREWTEVEDAILADRYRADVPLYKIAKELRVAPSTASMRLAVLGLKQEPAELPRIDRWACGHCGTRSDAALDFGCGQCLPLRMVAA